MGTGTTGTSCVTPTKTYYIQGIKVTNTHVIPTHAGTDIVTCHFKQQIVHIHAFCLALEPNIPIGPKARKPPVIDYLKHLDETWRPLDLEQVALMEPPTAGKLFQLHRAKKYWTFLKLFARRNRYTLQVGPRGVRKISRAAPLGPGRVRIQGTDIVGIAGRVKAGMHTVKWKTGSMTHRLQVSASCLIRI